MGKFFRDRHQDREATTKYFVNEDIRSESVLVITSTGDNHGVVSRNKALGIAQDAQLDLVQVGEKDGVVVAKVMDFGKFLYEKKKQQHDAKKHQKVVLIKEVKMRPNIGDQDYKTKLNRAIQFFKDGKKVKFTIQFKGREIGMMRDLGTRFFERVTSDLKEAELGGSLVEEKEGRSGAFWSKIYGIRD